MAVQTKASPLIADHGLTGALETAALFATDELSTGSPACCARAAISFDVGETRLALSLIREEGDERNRDDRYTRIRDGSFSVQTLTRIGFVYQATAFRLWLSERITVLLESDTGPLAVRLKVTQVGFVASNEPTWRSALRAMDAELESQSVVYRDNHSACPDGRSGSEGTFPQAFPHLALIDTDITLKYCVDDAAHQTSRPGQPAAEGTRSLRRRSPRL